MEFSHIKTNVYVSKNDNNREPRLLIYETRYIFQTLRDVATSQRHQMSIWPCMLF